MKMKFFTLAKKLSYHSDHTQHRHGSVITRRNKIVSVGYNKNRTSPRSPHKWNRLHAETVAIINAKEDLNGCEIYIYRETKHGDPAMSRPCPSCYSQIKEAGIKKIYYSVDGSFKEEIVT